MKSFILRSLIISAFLGHFSLIIAQTNKIVINISGIKDTTIILGHYFEKKILVDDTISIGSDSKAIWSSDKKLPEGIYVVYLPNKTYFDILIGNDQSFSIKTSNSDYLKSMSITGSIESQNFLKHQLFLNDKQKYAAELQKQLKSCVNNTDSTKLVNDQLQALQTVVMDYWNKAIDDNKGTFLSVFLNALQDVKIPPLTVDESIANKDSALQMKKYFYYKNHYFDNIALTDDRLLRTPFFAHKVESFFANTVFQIPDSLSNEAIILIDKCRPNAEMYKFMIQYLFNYAVESKMMGMDAMVVAIGEKYYLSGEANWVTPEFTKELTDRIRLIKPTMLGKTAFDLKLESVSGEYFRLSEVFAPYTILVFWEPGCGHCKTEIPKLNNEVWQKYSSRGIKIFAVYTQREREIWETFIEEHNLNEWINVYDPNHLSRFRDHYDVSSTPIIFILDKNKKIVAKRIGVENIPGFFEHEIKYGRL